MVTVCEAGHGVCANFVPRFLLVQSFTVILITCLIKEDFVGHTFVTSSQNNYMHILTEIQDVENEISKNIR